ncbi:MAG: GumC family protein [Paludibacteraceae bacterium]
MENENTIQNANAEIDIKALLLFVLRKWYVFAIAIAICVALVSVYYLCTARQYATNATIMLRSDSSSALNNISIAGFSAADFGLGGGRQIDNEIEIIRSRQLLSQVINELGLRTTVYRKVKLRYIEQFDESPLTVISPDGFEATMRGALRIDVTKKSDGTYRLKFKRVVLDNTERFKCTVPSLAESVETPWGVFRFVENPQKIPTFADPDATTYTVRFDLNSEKNQIDALSKKIIVAQTNKKANTISLSYTSSNPRKNEALLSKIIELYNRGELADKNKLQTETFDFLTDRLALISDELQQAEINLETYKKGRNIADISTQAQLYIETASDYEKRIAAADLQYNLVSFVENYLQDAADTDLIPNNTGVQDETLGNMMTSYNTLVMKYSRISRSTTEVNPVAEQMLAEIRMMRGNILQTITNVKKSIQITKQDLMAKNREFTTQINAVPTVEREYVSLARERELKQAVYLTLLKQREMTQMQLASTIETARVIDPAYTAERAVAPKLSVLLVLAVMGGAVLAAVYLYIMKFMGYIK